MLNNKKTEKATREWIAIIEENCIFGEFARLNNERCIIIFDDITEYGIKKIKEKGLELGVDTIYIAKHLYSNKKKQIKKFELLNV